MRISYANADRVVDRASTDVFWEGWNIVIFDDNQDGYMRRTGMYRKNTWGVRYVISPDDNGMWNVPKRYERFFKRTRN